MWLMNFNFSFFTGPVFLYVVAFMVCDGTNALNKNRTICFAVSILLLDLWVPNRLHKFSIIWKLYRYSLNSGFLTCSLVDRLMFKWSSLLETISVSWLGQCVRLMRMNKWKYLRSFFDSAHPGWIECFKGINRILLDEIR